MNKEKLINDCVGHIAGDVWKKDVLTYKEQDEYKEYLSTIIETITKEQGKEIERLNIKLEKIKDIILCYGETFDNKLHQEIQQLILDVLEIKTEQAESKEGK